MVTKGYTQEDIAKRLNISRVTVSHVLNKRSDNWVSDELRDAIFSTAKEMNYRPPLRKKRSAIRSLALITPSVEAEIYVKLIRGVTRIAEKQEYSLMVTDNMGDELKLISNALKRGVDGIILSPSPRLPGEAEKFVVKMSEITKPLVCVDTFFRGTEVSRVLFDYENCCRDLVKTLVAEGRTRIGFITYLNFIHPVLDRRYDGYRLGLSDCGIAEIPAMVQYRATRYDSHTGKTFDLDGIIDNFIEAGAQAIIANTDHMAIMIVNRLRQKGIEVPGKMHVIGFDDLAAGRINHPAITTVSQPWEKMGESAAEILLDQISNGRQQTNQIMLTTKLQIRET